MNQGLKKIVYPIYNFMNQLDFVQSYKLKTYLKNGRRPWSFGYTDYKTKEINRIIQDKSILDKFLSKDLPSDFGQGLDERIFEYGWLFSKLPKLGAKFLDAGSTFNFKYILKNRVVKEKDLTIFTFYPEIPSFKHLDNVNYVYGDLRKMPFIDESFEVIVSQSTIEHIDMDNSMYGYELGKNEDSNQKSYDYLKALSEFNRVLAPGGVLLLTFPYGIFKNYGFFQQFDEEMVDRMVKTFEKTGNVNLSFAKYENGRWDFSDQNSCNGCLSHNPSTGEDKGDDGAAHSRSICLIEYLKK